MTDIKKLKLYLKEAFVHIERLDELLNYLKVYYPINDNILEEIDLDKLDAFAFRFAKLQDLLGTKIFRSYLEVINFPIQDKSFLEILKELDKEGMIDIDKWSKFRGVRNSISHDYPYEIEEKIEAINYLIKNVDYLFEITQKIGNKVEIEQ